MKKLIFLLLILLIVGCGRNTVGPAMEEIYEIPNYPEIEPNTGFQCLPLSLENMLRYYGKDIKLPASRYTGLELGLYTVYLFVIGFDVVEIKPDPDVIRSYIFNGIPVLFIIYKGDKTAHAAVGFKYNKDGGFGLKDSSNLGDTWVYFLPTRCFILDRR